MKVIIIVASLGLLYFSCSQAKKAELSPKETEHYDMDCCTMAGVHKQKIHYSAIIKDSIYTLTYIIEREQKMDTIIYRLKQNHTYNPEYVYNNKPDELFSLVASTNIMVWGDSVLTKGLNTYKVYKYASNGVSMDGCYSHFWIPEFGIILKRNPTWGDFQKLSTSNDSINQQIELLADIIYQG